MVTVSHAVSLRPLRANETQDERTLATTTVAPISRAPVPGMTAGVDLMASTSSTAGVDPTCSRSVPVAPARLNGKTSRQSRRLDRRARCDLYHSARVPLSTGALVRSPTPAPTMKPVTRLFATPSQPRSRWREEERKRSGAGRYRGRDAASSTASASTARTQPHVVDDRSAETRRPIAAFPVLIPSAPRHPLNSEQRAPRAGPSCSPCPSQ